MRRGESRLPGLHAGGARGRGAARPRRPRRRADQGVRPRAGRTAPTRRRPALAALPDRRAGGARAAADRPVGLARPGPAGPPGAAAGLPRHRPVHAAEPADAGRPLPRGAGPAAAPASGPTRSSTTPRRCAATVTGDQPWSLLGQSYGGFVATDLPVRRAGVADPGDGDRWASRRWGARRRRSTARRPRGWRERWARFAERYPDDPARLDRVADRVAGGDVRLPSGDLLTVQRLQSLGMTLGYADGLERLHYLLETAFVGTGTGSVAELSDDFLVAVESATSFVTRPLYALLHESIYCDGGSSGWAAQQVTRRPPGAVARRPAAAADRRGDLPVDVRGRRRADPAARGRRAAWRRTSGRPSTTTTASAKNDVPVAAAVFHDDMYVESAFSLDAASRIGNARSVGHQRARPRRAAHRRARHRAAARHDRRRGVTGSRTWPSAPPSCSVAEACSGPTRSACCTRCSRRTCGPTWCSGRRSARSTALPSRPTRPSAPSRPSPRCGSGSPTATSTGAARSGGPVTWRAPGPTCTPTSRCASC